ncbi:MAG: hypothetical protein LAQ30_15140 [Acidobacteriia bacterium]|nr:hypothetical protein [Terriglobia bacterium]
MTPGELPPPVASPSAAEAAQVPAPGCRWYHRMSAVLFTTFCLEIGFFLLIFPWTSYANDFAAFRPEWRPYWDNTYIRGAISGLGAVNLYIACLEVFRLRRFAKR